MERRDEIILKKVLSEIQVAREFISGCYTVRLHGGRLDLDKAESKCSTSVEIEGESEIAVGFDPRFMKDALTQFKDEPRVRIKLSGGSSPIIIEAEGRNDFAMVLPVRLYGAMAA